MVQLKEFHEFAGAGGGILGSILLGHKPVGAIEIERYPREILLGRQADGILPRFDIWDDIRTFRIDNPETREYIEYLCSINSELCISGGFPCQDISAAGKGAGIDGERSGLWTEMARTVREIRPAFVFVENSPRLTIRGLWRVLGDLSEMGYHARWCVLGADDAGAPHERKRIWVLAYTSKARLQGSEQREACYGNWNRAEAYGSVGERSEVLADSQEVGRREGDEISGRTRQGAGTPEERDGLADSGFSWWQFDPAEISDTAQGNDRERQTGTIERQKQESGKSNIGKTNRPAESDLGRMVDELASEMEFARTTFGGCVPRVATGIDKRIDRLKAIGNGQVPLTAVIAWLILTQDLLNT